MSSDDLTPAPRTGESVQEYRRRVSTAFAAGNITPERTHLRVDLVRAFVIASGLVVAGVAAATGYWRLTGSVDQLNQRLVDLASTLASKAELAGVKDDARRQARGMLRKLVVVCPRQRGEAATACRVQLPDDE